jgi:DNA-binding response OmpR family regulator
MVVLQAEELDLVEVLFIADDSDLAEMYRLKLELDGYWVRTIGLDRAVAAARARRPDIIFLDLPAGDTERLEILRGRSLVPPTSW